MRLLCLLVVVCAAYAARHPALPPFLLGKSTGGLINFRGNQLDTPFPGTKGNFTQKIDNFDANNTATYLQRYWHNPSFSKNNGVVFLLIQGESIATDDWAADPSRTYQRLASLYGADIFQLEHRCFGFSRPYPDMTFDHLTTCGIDQALADINAFILGMNTQFGIKNPKWVTFGGSYPGALSALFRMKYPSATVGAVASSAPMLWTLDFFQYAQVVDKVLLSTDPVCHDQVASAFSQMQTLSLSNDGREQLNNYFNLSPRFVAGKTSQLDIDNFFANVYSYFQGVVQYTYDGRSNATRNGFDVLHLCNVMKSDQNPIVSVNNTINWVNQANGDPVGPFANSYSDMMKVLSNTSFDDENTYQDNAAARGWMWLCCNEMGALQTTDQGRNVFQQTVTLNYFVDMCTQMFDPKVDIKYIRDRNLQLMYRYGGAAGYKATNVVLPNGEYDPWHVLGAYKNDTTNHMTSILIPKAAHCSDMYMKYPNEPATLDSARDLINREVAFFIGANYVPLP